MMKMKLKAGYKNTDVGVIPKDWGVDAIKNLAVIKTGSKNTQDRIESGVYPFFVRSQTVERINSFSFDGEAVLTAGDGVGVGKVMHYINGKFDCHQRVYRISNFSENLEGYFFYLYFSTNFYSRIMQMTAKSSVDSVRMEMIADMQIPLPPTKSEQTAIANALSDADALISSLEKLIEKKRNIKQGAMQQLLKPKKGWDKKSIKEIVQTPVTDGPHETPVFYAMGIPFLSVNNLVDKKIDFTDLRYISVEDHLIYSKKCKPQRNDILLGKAASVGKVAIVETDLEFNIWSPIAMIRVKSDYSSKYVYYYLQTEDIVKQIDFFTNSSSQGNIGMGDIEKIEIPLPKTLAEQKEIATILSDMDNEISSLEKKLSKSKMLKQGMMQELLTGKIRLV